MSNSTGKMLSMDELIEQLRVCTNPVTSWALREIIHDRLNRRMYD